MALWILSITSLLFLSAFVFYLFKASRLSERCATLSKENQEANQALTQLTSKMHGLQKMLTDSTTDDVTHLIGWQVFVDRVNQKLHESARYNTTLAVMHLEISNFHIFNDVFGAEVSQQLLLEAANRIQSCVRVVDSVARSSSHRFSMLLVNISKAESAALVVQRIMRALSQPIQINDHTLYLNVHFGIAVHPGDGSDSVTLFSKAEQALEQARSRKGNQGYQFYQESSQQKSQYELAIASGLMRDTLLQELDVLYHPIYDAKTKSVFCLQATFNWYDAQIGFVDSMTLFQYADKQGKSNHMVEWIFRKACQHFLAWRKENAEQAVLSLPVSAEQLKNNHFIHRLTQLLKECQFKPDWLMLEIVHDASFVWNEDLDKTINMLKYLRVKLAVHGFMHKALSIELLERLSAEYLLLDRAFFQSVLEGGKHLQVMRSLQELATGLSMQVIMTGVENNEELHMLASMGCRYLQGPFLSPRMFEQAVT